jgi:G:T-mismatch repair DNA endonuclease (very short patch repair protein)
MSREKQAVRRTCPVCGSDYSADPVRLGFGRQTTCSRTCSYALRAGKRDNKTRVACAVCGREMERSPSQIKGKYGTNFCSRACHYSGRSTGASRRVVVEPYTISNAARVAWKAGAEKTHALRKARDNYRHTEQSRAKLSEATARTLAEGRCRVVSKIEQKVATGLDTLGVRYERQRAFRDDRGRFAFVVDFWLPDLNAAIEVNGTYWHADPRVYPAPINATQVHCLGRYRRKVESLKRQGIRVAEVWELDLKRDPAQAVIEAYARLTAR